MGITTSNSLSDRTIWEFIEIESICTPGEDNTVNRGKRRRSVLANGYHARQMSLTDIYSILCAPLDQISFGTVSVGAEWSIGISHPAVSSVRFDWKRARTPSTISSSDAYAGNATLLAHCEMQIRGASSRRCRMVTSFDARGIIFPRCLAPNSVAVAFCRIPLRTSTRRL